MPESTILHGFGSLPSSRNKTLQALKNSWFSNPHLTSTTFEFFNLAPCQRLPVSWSVDGVPSHRARSRAGHRDECLGESCDGVRWHRRIEFARHAKPK